MPYQAGQLETPSEGVSEKGSRWLEIKVTRLYLSRNRDITFRCSRGRGWERWQLNVPEKAFLAVVAVAVASWPLVQKAASGSWNVLWKSIRGEVSRDGGSSSPSRIPVSTPPNLNAGRLILKRGGNVGNVLGVRAGVLSGNLKHRGAVLPITISYLFHPHGWNLIAPASSVGVPNPGMRWWGLVMCDTLRQERTCKLSGPTVAQ